MGQDFVGGLGPYERVAALVPSGDEVGDGGGEFFDAVEGPPADCLAGDDGEEHRDEIEPRARCRGEMQGDPWVLASQALTSACL